MKIQPNRPGGGSNLRPRGRGFMRPHTLDLIGSAGSLSPYSYNMRGREPMRAFSFSVAVFLALIGWGAAANSDREHPEIHYGRVFRERTDSIQDSLPLMRSDSEGEFRLVMSGYGEKLVVTTPIYNDQFAFRNSVPCGLLDSGIVRTRESTMS